jgi:prefoldin subunit 5
VVIDQTQQALQSLAHTINAIHTLIGEYKESEQIILRLQESEKIYGEL